MRKVSNFLSGLAGAVLGSLLLASAAVWAVPTTLPLPAIQGPYLGDFGNNLYAITQAYGQGQGHFVTSGLSVSQTNTQAACTNLSSGDIFQQITTSASTGSACLPAAAAGRMIFVLNATGQTVDLYGNAAAGDTINQVAGSTAYAGLTTGKLAICAAAVAGKWNCGTGS